MVMTANDAGAGSHAMVFYIAKCLSSRRECRLRVVQAPFEVKYIDTGYRLLM